MADFAPGDKVKLKSPFGPVMTVEAVGLKGTMGKGFEDGVRCVWFDEEEKPQSETFESAVLQKYEEESSDDFLE